MRRGMLIILHPSGPRSAAVHNDKAMKTITKRRLALALTSALLTVATMRAAEIKVVTSGAFTAAYLKLVPEYERATHNKLGD